MTKYVASKEDKFYWQGAMDAIGLLKIEGMLDKEGVERARKVMASMGHTHYQSVIGPYCVVCHISLLGPTYSKWEDGQEAV